MGGAANAAGDVATGGAGSPTQKCLLMSGTVPDTNELQLVIAEPWDLAESADGSPKMASIEAADDEAPASTGRLLLEVREPIRHGGVTYGRFLATAQNDKSLVQSFRRDGVAEANLYGIPLKDVAQRRFDLDWWRGGLGIIATLAVSRIAN